MAHPHQIFRASRSRKTKSIRGMSHKVVSAAANNSIPIGLGCCHKWDGATCCNYKISWTLIAPFCGGWKLPWLPHSWLCLTRSSQVQAVVRIVESAWITPCMMNDTCKKFRGLHPINTKSSFNYDPASLAKTPASEIFSNAFFVSSVRGAGSMQATAGTFTKLHNATKHSSA
jgi:hypothetical protein